MKITYLGHSCFRLVSEGGTAIVTDPYKGVGYDLLPNLTADAVMVSHGHFDHNNTEAVHTQRIISRSGAYTVNEIAVTGISTWHDAKQGALRGANVVYCMKIDGMTVCHLGDIGEPCCADIVERIGQADVLLIPVGGTYTIDASQAKEYVERLSPKAVIPMHYRPEDGALDITDCTPFLSLFDHNKLRVVKDGETELTADGLSKDVQIIYMERKKK